MNGLNDGHRLRIRVTLEHVDELLSQIMRDLEPGAGESLFNSLIADIKPIQRKVMGDYVLRLRVFMHDLLVHYGIPLPEPSISASWAARALLTSAENSILELRASRMAGYGLLPEEEAKEIDSMVAQLVQLLGKMGDYLAQGTAHDLRKRVEHLSSSLSSARLLSDLERIITTHALLELRPMLEAILERLESPALEIAVFGRVKTGKSSLLNHILQTDVLPVGVTPITAVPTRIVYSAQAGGKVWFAQRPMETIALERLADFATEQGNPANCKQVTRIEAAIPSPTLQQGIVFVDTPGIGSLALSGAAESLAYLPRCDLGIVLVDSASTLNAEDLSLVDLLHRSGADVMLLLSKADVLAPGDREVAAAYVRRQLQANTGLELPVHAVSIQGADVRLCDRWLTETLMPTLQDHRQMAERSLGRKINGLKQAVLSALQRRLSSGSGTGKNASWTDLNRRLADALKELDTARLHRGVPFETVAELTEETIDEVAAEIVARSRAEPDWQGEASAVLAAALERKGAALATSINTELAALRAKLLSVLQATAEELGWSAIDEDDMPKPANLPVMESRGTGPPFFKVNIWSRWFGERILYRSIRKQVCESAESAVLDTLTHYGEILEKWRQSILAELRRSYTVKSDFLLAQRPIANAAPNLSSNDLETLRKDWESLRQMNG